MKTTTKVNFKEPIILLKLLDNGALLVVDAQTTIRLLNKETLDVVAGFKANIAHHRYKTSVIDYSSDSKYFVALSTDCREAILYDLKTKKVISKVDRHQGEISCVAIDPLNRYSLSCGDDGKTFGVDMKSGKFIFTLPAHADTINDVVFSKDGQWIATASYDRSISLFNLSMMTSKHHLKSHSAPVVKLRFLNNHRLLSIDKNNSAIIWDYYKGKVLSRLKGLHDDATQVVTSKDDKFLFVGTQLGYILVYDLYTNELLDAKYLKLSATVTALTFDESTNNLIVASKQGDIVFHNIFEGLDDIKKAITKKDFITVEKLMEQNAVLRFTDAYSLMEKAWQKSIDQAKLYLEKSDKKRAVDVVSAFKKLPSKNTKIKKLFSDYEEFDKFVLLASQNKLALCYSLASKYPSYKDSQIYKNLELNWKKTFNLARKYVNEPKGGKDKAREILSSYRGISQKTILIQELLTQGDVYNRFRGAISKKDFKISFELIKQHPFLKEFPEYDSLMNYADTLYINIQQLMQKGDGVSAMKIVRVLSSFSDFEDEVKELTQEIQNKQKFVEAVDSQNTSLAYNLMAHDHSLQETPAGQKLHNLWNADVAKANEYATAGDANALAQILDRYSTTSSKYLTVANLFAWCYMTQIEKAIDAKQPQHIIENGIQKYMIFFGLSEQISSLFSVFITSYPDSTLILEDQTKGSINMWRSSSMVKSILED